MLKRFVHWIMAKLRTSNSFTVTTVEDPYPVYRLGVSPNTIQYLISNQTDHEGSVADQEFFIDVKAYKDGEQLQINNIAFSLPSEASGKITATVVSSTSEKTQVKVIVKKGCTVVGNLGMNASCGNATVQGSVSITNNIVPVEPRMEFSPLDIWYKINNEGKCWEAVTMVNVTFTAKVGDKVLSNISRVDIDAPSGITVTQAGASNPTKFSVTIPYGYDSSNGSAITVTAIGADPYAPTESYTVTGTFYIKGQYLAGHDTIKDKVILSPTKKEAELAKDCDDKIFVINSYHNPDDECKIYLPNTEDVSGRTIQIYYDADSASDYIRIYGSGNSRIRLINTINGYNEYVRLKAGYTLSVYNKQGEVSWILIDLKPCIQN